MVYQIERRKIIFLILGFKFVFKLYNLRLFTWESTLRSEKLDVSHKIILKNLKNKLKDLVDWKKTNYSWRSYLSSMLL